MLFLCFYVVHQWREREKQVTDLSELLKKMFGRYLSTEVMNTIIEKPSTLELGGERRKVSIIITDLRGFTALSERLEPEQVVRMLNIYFEVMVDIILKYGGTINEIIGDSLLIIFGAPQQMPDRMHRAVACAISMQNAMTQVNRENSEAGLPIIEMGIGINETEAIVGNIGSSKRSKYTVIGSGVNMASRIESYSVGGQILISESIHKNISDDLMLTGQKEIFPKGAESPIRIFEVSGIGESFNLALTDSEDTIYSLDQTIPLRCVVLGGKHIGKQSIEGSIIKLSKKKAEIEIKDSIKLLSNLKLNLTNVDETLISKGFYAKVTEKETNEDNTYIKIQFTSMPSEISAYFQAFLSYRTK